MKWLKKLVLSLILLLAVASLLLVITGNAHLFKAIANTYLIGRTGPSIEEYAIFPHREIKTSSHQPWLLSKQYNTFNIPQNYLDQMEKFDPVAFLVIHKDSIVLEKYWDGYDENTPSNSFSMAKTIVSIMTCMALDEGKIKSVDQKVGDFLPQFKEGKGKELTIRHLLSMSSGINFDESYGDPFGFMAKAYYGTDLENKTLQYEVVESPGSNYHYLGGNTILLSLIIKKATGKTLSEYCSEKLWQPIGAKNDALWSLDEDEGIEKAYCCFYSNARDFARIGKLYMHNGNWEGKQLLDTGIVRASIQPAKLNSGENVDYYAWQWWVGNYKEGPFFYARGILGQYILVIPQLEMIVVRLGHKRAEKLANNHIEDVFVYQDLAIELKKHLSN